MSKKIEDIDVNFRRSEIGGRELVFADALKAPFELTGFAWHHQERELCRLPAAVLPHTNDGVRYLAWNTSGGMIRFRTDATTIAIRSELRDPGDMSHMPRNGSAGFDLYLGTGSGKAYFKSVMPGSGAKRLEGVLGDGLPSGVMRDWTFYMPLYGGASAVEIGLTPGCGITEPTPFTTKKPLAFYGSSITQGGCASRTGNAYAHFLARWVDAPVINLGFSGSGRGEPAVAKAIAELEMSAFIFDYDHNAPNPAHLEATHEPFFQIIRRRQPDLPVIMMSKCDYQKNTDCDQRREVIRRTWKNAVDRGDRNAYFIDGETLFGTDNRDACTVDGCHPNDLGFFRMAKTILPVLSQALGITHR